MLIGKKYKIESDSLNITVYKKAKSKNTGTTNWRVIAFFSKTKNAMKYLANLELMETGLKDINTIIKKQDFSMPTGIVEAIMMESRAVELEGHQQSVTNNTRPGI